MSSSPLAPVINSLQNLAPNSLNSEGEMLTPNESEMVSSLLSGLIEIVQTANLTHIPVSQ